MFLSFTALSLVFLLKDGPLIRRWGERHLGFPPSLAHTITGRVIVSLRDYFGGVTIVAAFNAIVIGLGALVLGVPLAGLDRRGQLHGRLHSVHGRLDRRDLHRR